MVTATRIPQPLSQLLADVTVIDAAEIALAGQSSLVELLQHQPGVEIASNGGPASLSSVFLRGANSGHTLVLVDGLRVDSSTDGASPLEAIPLAQVERIEILRGPASALYGADAIGGVIQIFTRRGEGAPRVNAAFGAGSYGTLKADAGVAGSSERWRYSLHAGQSQSDGFSAIRNPDNFSYNPDRDGYRATSASGELALRYGKQDELAFNFLANHLNAQYDAAPDFDDRTRTRLENYALAARNQWTAAWQTLLRAGRSVDDIHLESGFGPASFRTQQDQYLWQNDLSLAGDRMQLALERREERLASDTPYSVTSRDTNSALAVYQVQGAAYAVQANVRYDDSTQFGARTTGSLALGYRFSEQWRLSASAGNAFKVPSFNDLYYPGFSNPNLRPETARNVEGGVHYSMGLAGADLVAYRNRVHDLIVFQCDANFNCAPVNVDEARLSGATLSGHATWNGTQLQASMDFQQPEDATTGNMLPRRARRHAALVASHTWGDWTLGAEWVASSQRYDDAANTKPMGGYGLTNLTAAWHFAPAWQVLLRANNVGNKQYELAQDYGTPGANVFVAVQYQP